MNELAAPDSLDSLSLRVVVHSAVRVTRRDAEAVDVTGKSAVILAMVALEGRAERRRLALLLWPDSPEPQARNNLRTLVHRLNQRFGAELLVGADTLSLHPRHAQVVPQDTDALLAALAQGGAQNCELLEHAGVEVDTSEALREWLDAARQRLRRIHLAGLRDALAQAQARGNMKRAVELAHACVRLEPLSEQWHRQLMNTLARCGDQAAALAAYEDCKARLRKHLGVLPDIQTRTVQLRILQGHAAGQPEIAAESTPLGGSARYPLVEREAVLAQVRDALAKQLHVAIEGEAGVGKTRLLHQLAAHSDVEQLALRAGAREQPYAAIAQLLQEVQPRRKPQLGVPEQIELARLVPLAFPEVEPSRASLSAPRLHAALRHWFARLRAAGVQRLVLDDVHHADAASQAAIAAMLDSHDDRRLPSLLMTLRSGDIGYTLEEALVAAQSRRQALCIRLPRLNLPGVRALLDAVDRDRRAAQPEALAAQLLKRTGGNPLFVIELAQHALDNAEAGLGAASASLGTLLRSRLGARSEAARQLAYVAAIATDNFSVELAAFLTGQPLLALMPPWSELQRVGLFADHGLAHELVREAVLGAIPVAIGRSLHRQVAGYLESLGMKGVSVLRHWLAAEDFDRALPHVVQQLHANTAAGTDGTHLEQTLLELLERVSDAALVDNLWITAEIHEESMRVDGWARIAALVQRAARLSGSVSTAAWIAFETSRLAYFRDNAIKRAYDTLWAAVRALPARGVERAWAELALLTCSFVLDGSPRDHFRRAQNAVAELPESPHQRRLRRHIEVASAIFCNPRDALAAESGSMRAARRRGDGAAAAESRLQIASIQAKLGNYARAHRQLVHVARWRTATEAVPDELLVETGFAAMNSGRFVQALRCLELAGERFFAYRHTVFLAIVMRRLGQWDSAHASFADADPDVVGRHFNTIIPAAVVRGELDGHAGRDPLPALRETMARMKAMGMGGVNLQLMNWEILRRTAPADERIAAGSALVGALKAHSHICASWLRTVIELAESHAEVGSAGCRALALEAGQALARGYGSHTLYIPDGLVRCSLLLRKSDPAQAARLTHVAARWVRQALPQVPQFARESFVTEIPVNRFLLAESPTGPRHTSSSLSPGDS